MSKHWEWTKPHWDTHFGGVGGAQGRAYQVSYEEFNERFFGQMEKYFPDECFFDLGKLVEESALEQRAKTAAVLAENTHRCFGVLDLDGELAALFSGCSFSPRAWRMWVTVVAPQFRRQGIYSRILAGHLGYAKALGFDVVRSEHAPCNNPIIIAKLQAGFNITSLEIDAGNGPSLILTYFLRPEHKKAYEFRSGVAVMTPPMLQSGNEAMKKLASQMGEASGVLEKGEG